MAAGKPANTPAAIVRRCSWPDQRVVFDDALARRRRDGCGRDASAGDRDRRAGCRGRSSHDWFAARPLFGRRIMVTRPIDQAETLCMRLSELGAECLVQPAIQVGPPDDWVPVDAELARLRSLRLAGILELQRRAISARSVGGNRRRFAAVGRRAPGRDGTGHERGVGSVSSPGRSRTGAISGRSTGRTAGARGPRQKISTGPREPRPGSIGRADSRQPARAWSRSSSTQARMCQSRTRKLPPNWPPAESIGSR